MGPSGKGSRSATEGSSTSDASGLLQLMNTTRDGQIIESHEQQERRGPFLFSRKTVKCLSCLESATRTSRSTSPGIVPAHSLSYANACAS
jgi:hypothetical protein